MPKYLLWSFLILAVISIDGGRIPFHPLTEIKCIIYLLFSCYPIWFFFSNFHTLKKECKILTYSYIYVITLCIIGLFKMLYKETGLYPVDTFQNISATLAFGWFFVSLKKPISLCELINFSLKKWPILFFILLLPFYNIGFLRNYLFFLLPFLLFFKFASLKSKLTFTLFLFFFFLYPGQRIDLLYIIIIVLVIITKEILPIQEYKHAKITIILCFIAPIASVLAYFINGFNILNFESYMVSNKQYGNENLFDDTRTFLYEESINSILNNGTWLLGETPAFGYTSQWYTNFTDSTHTISRLSEAGIVNIYVWFGLIGLLSFTVFFIYICKLSLHSNSKIIWLLGIYTAIFYAISWIGNCNIWITNSRIVLFLIMGFIYYSSKHKLPHSALENYIKKMLKS